MWSLDRVAKLYYLIMECENARLIGCHFPGLGLKKGISFRLRSPFKTPYSKFAGEPHPPGFKTNITDRLQTDYQSVDCRVTVGQQSVDVSCSSQLPLLLCDSVIGNAYQNIIGPTGEKARENSRTIYIIYNS